MKRDKLEKIASEISNPCVTISMNTHRTHPDNTNDIIQLKNLVKEAEVRVSKEYEASAVKGLLAKLREIESEISFNYNLESLHIFLSNNTKEIAKSSWPVQHDTIQVAESFAVKPLIKDFNRAKEYMILLMSQSGVKLFHALNDNITGEITNDDFPFTENPHITSENDNISDPKKKDNIVREFLNKIDKALVKVHNENEMKCVVISTEENYSHLMKVADKPSMFYGHVGYNNSANHSIATDAWRLVKAMQFENRGKIIEEMQEAVGKGNVITDLAEILRAVKEGRGDLLITHDDFHQAVKMTGEYSFVLVNDGNQQGAIADITSEIAWEVISKKGRAIFTDPEEMKSLGDIALKVRY